MSQIIEVKVPDIGDFKNVPIIEIAVKVGDSVAAEEALMTLESDKATIDVPSPCDGIIKEITVKAGDKVSEGSVIARIEASASVAATAAAPTEPPPTAATPSSSPTPPVSKPDTSVSATSAAPASAPQAGQFSGKADIECEMLVLGAGPGG